MRAAADATDETIARLTRAAALLAEPLRARLLLELADGGPLAVNELAARLGLPQPRVSTQLAALRAAGWVAPLAEGRQRRYQLSAPRLPDALQALAATAPPPVARTNRPLARKPRPGEPARAARSCYDHLAGVAGVKLCDALQARGWLAPAAGGGGGKHQPDYALTDAGRRALAARGVTVPDERRAGRRAAYACPDWTEARPHLGGALGAAVLDRLLADGYVSRPDDTRALRVERDLAEWLG